MNICKENVLDILQSRCSEHLAKKMASHLPLPSDSTCTFSSGGRATDSSSVGPGFESLKVHQFVILTLRVHPFPFRTRKLSSTVPTILSWRRLGKIGHREHNEVSSYFTWSLDQKQRQLVLLTLRVHPFPFRTRKLSSTVPTILSWRRLGKIGQRQLFCLVFLIFLLSSVGRAHDC